MSILAFTVRRSSEAGNGTSPTVEAYLGGMTMRFMLILKANQDSEAGTMPSEEQIAATVRYNQEQAKAGILLDAAGLYPSSTGARINVSAGGKKTVVDGPFTESKELVAGYWIIEVKSIEEAIEWAKRAPVGPGHEVEIEVRRFIEFED
jgi:hypothetical protein